MHTQTYIYVYIYSIYIMSMAYIPHIYICTSAEAFSRTNNAIDTHLYKLYYILVTFCFSFALLLVSIFVLFVILFSLFAHIRFRLK